MDSETVMERLTPERIRQDLKGDAWPMLGQGLAFLALSVLFFLFHLLFWYKLPNRSLETFCLFQFPAGLFFLVALIFLGCYAYRRFLIRRGDLFLDTDMLIEKVRRRHRWPNRYSSQYMVFRFARYGKFPLGPVRYYRWSDLFCTNGNEIFEAANPEDTFLIVRLGGKHIRMIYNTRWFSYTEDPVQYGGCR